MKHPILLTALLSMFFFTSCNTQTESAEPGTYPDTAAFVTIFEVEDVADEDKMQYYFQTDSGVNIFLADNALTSEYDFVGGVRLIAYFAIIEDYTKESVEPQVGADYDCDYGMRLFGLRNIYSSKSAVVNTEEESDEIADHAIAYLYNTISYSHGYINMLAGLRADKMANTKLYLVENLSVDPDKTKEGYFNLEMRYDRGTDEPMGSTYEEYVSLSVADFEEKLEGKEGIILRVLTTNSGTVNVTLDFEEEDEDDVSQRVVSRARSAAQKL